MVIAPIDLRTVSVNVDIMNSMVALYGITAEEQEGKYGKLPTYSVL